MDKQFCGECGHEVNEGALFCNNCGAKQEVPESSEVQSESQAPVVETPHCISCGKELKAGAAFCPACGSAQAPAAQQIKPQVQATPAPVQAAVSQPVQTQAVQSQPGQTVIVNQVAQAEKNGIGVAGFVLSIAAIVLSWVPVLDFILWLLGAIFSVIGIFKKPKGLAIAGAVISFLGLIILIILIFVVGAIGGFGLLNNGY